MEQVLHRENLVHAPHIRLRGLKPVEAELWDSDLIANSVSKFLH